ncbi:MAG: response regulator [Hyphomicrobiaceae bacterium]
MLLADDDPIFAAIGSSTLRRRGCNVVVAGDGGIAFDALMQDSFDVAVVDLSMPEVDGFRLIALVRSTSRTARLPIIVVTVRDDAEAIEEARRLGANLFLTKPVNWDRLHEQILSLVDAA